MDTRKLIVRISYGLNAVLIIVIVGLLVHQQRLIRQMTGNMQLMPPTASISGSNTKAENSINTIPISDGGVEQLTAEVETLRYQLEAAEEKLDMALEDLSNAQDGQTKDLSDLNAMQKKMQENPVVRKMRRSQFEKSLNQTYGALFEAIGAQDEKTLTFKELLLDHQEQLMENYLTMMDQSGTDEKRGEKMQRLIAQQKAELEKQARDLLGAEKYEEYVAYEESLRERQLVASFLNPFGADNGLSVEKEQELIDAMYAARKEVYAEYGIDSSGTEIAMVVSQIDREKMRNSQLEIYDRYIESARSILSESQAEQFETRIKWMQETMAMAATTAESPPPIPVGSDDNPQ